MREESFLEKEILDMSSYEMRMINAWLKLYASPFLMDSFSLYCVS